MIYVRLVSFNYDLVYQIYAIVFTTHHVKLAMFNIKILKQDNDSTVRGDGGSRVGEVRAGTTSPMPEHNGFNVQ